MARVLSAAVAGLGALAGLGVLVAGVALVLSHRIDTVSAALVGGLALTVVEVAVGVSDRLRVVPSVPGTWVGRAGVVAVAVVAGLGLAVVIGPGGRASSASIVVGTSAVVVLVVLVGVQASRPAGPSGPARLGRPGPEVGSGTIPGRAWLPDDTGTSRIE